MITSSCCKRKTVSLLLAALLLAACGSEKPEALLTSAKEYLAKNDNKAAIIQIKNALQANPGLPEARFLLGKALLDSGDGTAAEVELRKALELKQPAEQVLPLLAKALLQTGQYKKLIDEFATIELATPEGKADLKTSIAIAHSGLGNTEAMNVALAAALTAQPDYAPALLAQSRIKAAALDFTGALAIVDAIVAKAPANSDAWKLKGDLLSAQSLPEQALPAYRKALAERPDFVAAHSAIVSLLMRQGKLEEAAQQLESLKKIAPKNPLSIFLETQIAYQQKDYKKARELALQLLKVAPNYPPALQLAGAIEFQLKSLVQADAYLSKALQAKPDLNVARRLLITTYLRSGQFAKALTTLRPVLENIDKDANMLALAGEVFMLNGEAKKAEEYFSKAASLDPQDARKRTALAMAHMIKGEVETAFGELELIAASDKGTSADLALISAYLRRGEFDKALKTIDGLEKKLPDDAMPANLRGQTLLAKQDIAGARQSFEKSLAISPTFFPAAASLARLDLADKRPEDARKRFEAVLAADPKNTQALLAIAELKAATGGTPEEVTALVSKAVQASPTDAAPRLVLVDLYLRNKDAKKATSAAQDAVAAIPDNALLLDALGRAQQAAGDSNQALATYNKLAALQPNSPQPLMRQAEVNAAAKNKDAAIQNLRRALEIKPDLVEAQRGLIALYLEAGSSAEAMAVAHEVRKQRPREAIGYLLEGDIVAAKKSWSEAITYYRSGLKEVPSPELAVRLHFALRADNQGGEADKFAADWLKQHPKDVAFMLYLGDLFSAKKDYEKAAGYYRNLLEIHPNNVIALNNLAWVTGQTKGSKAIEYAERANKLAPNQPAFMDTLAMLLAEKGEYAKALELLNQALKLQPLATSIRLNLAKVLIKSGDKAAARKELEELTRQGDKFPGQAEVAQLIKGL